VGVEARTQPSVTEDELLSCPAWTGRSSGERRPTMGLGLLSLPPYAALRSFR
jgi:hypothetical protein